LDFALDPGPTGESYRLKWDADVLAEQTGQKVEYQASTYQEPGVEPGLGDIVKNALAKLNITEAKVSKWLGRPCGCAERAARLNAIGLWAKRVMKNKIQNAREFLSNIIGEEVEADVEMNGRDPESMGRVRWAYGVTTCHARRNDLLPQTLGSLAAAGFDQPHLFVDGSSDWEWYRREYGLEVTCRYPALRVAGNWVLSMYELWYRHGDASHFAIFQDDLLASKNMRQYLSWSLYRNKDVLGYWNLYTIPEYEREAKERVGWHRTAGELGRGAVALVFSRGALITLLSARHLATRPGDTQSGHVRIDGGIVSSMWQAGWHEHFHYPSLVQHTGLKSAKSLGADYSGSLGQPDTFATSKCWRGEDFDCATLIDKPASIRLG
jgi:hypothetical protein